MASPIAQAHAESTHRGYENGRRRCTVWATLLAPLRPRSRKMTVPAAQPSLRKSETLRNVCANSTLRCQVLYSLCYGCLASVSFPRRTNREIEEVLSTRPWSSRQQVGALWCSCDGVWSNCWWVGPSSRYLIHRCDPGGSARSAVERCRRAKRNSCSPNTPEPDFEDIPPFPGVLRSSVDGNNGPTSGSRPLDPCVARCCASARTDVHGG